MFLSHKRQTQCCFDASLLIVRLALGLIFITFGILHVAGLESFITMFGDTFGFPAPGVLAPIAAWAELLGGLAVLLGIFPRLGAALLAVVMIVAMLFVKIPAGLESGNDVIGLTQYWDKDLALFAMALVVLISGAGRYALGYVFFRNNVAERL
jgi:putative oxidoreductase